MGHGVLAVGAKVMLIIILLPSLDFCMTSTNLPLVLNGKDTYSRNSVFKVNRIHGLNDRRV